MPADASRPLIGSSPRIRKVLDQVEKVGSKRFPVLILGESGTGKELIARAIHAQSAPGPFIVIDCSALVGQLMESELFGHVKGAFTGAATTKQGLIEAANGGTAFFDEVGELPLDMQAKLLRVLQEKEFRPVGALHPRRSDFRVVAATNRDLMQEVERGKFRQDLYYRLNVITVRLPALRERMEDIPALVHHFIRRNGYQQEISAETMKALVEYGWPGNIRELEHCVQHMVAVNAGNLVHLHDLPSTVLNHTIAAASAPSIFRLAGAVGQSIAPSPPRQLDDAPVVPLPELERRAIIDALRYTKGDRTTAANLLQIGRTTLYRKLREYQIESVE
ncbi:MAG: sigma-54 dependent transcriptional regulator [Bryobacteraceae bacterium]